MAYLSDKSIPAFNVRLGTEGRAKILPRKGVRRSRRGGEGGGAGVGGSAEDMLSSLKNFNSPESRKLNIAAKFAKTISSAGRGALSLC